MKKVVFGIFLLFITFIIVNAQPSDPGPDNCLDFNGTNEFVYLDEPTELRDLGLGDFTIEAWVKTSRSQEQCIIGNFNGYPAYSLITNSSGQFVFEVGSVLYNSGVNISDGEWHHIAGVKDNGSNIQLYVDGLLAYNHGSDPVGTFQVSNPTLIGNCPNNQNPFQGSIDEIRIWSSARSESQIRANAYNVLEGNESNLVAYYRFDESSGSLLPDETSNGLDGTLYYLGSELITNGTFNSDATGWTSASNWAWESDGGTGGWYRHSTGATDHAYQNALQIGHLYILSFTIGGRTAGSLDAVIGDFTHTGYISSNGDFLIYGGSASTAVSFYPSTDFDGYIDDVSAVEIIAGGADWVTCDAFNTWLGSTSSAWGTASNWSLNAVPSGENVGIYSFGNSPAISGSISVNDLYLGSGATLTSSSNYTVSGVTFINNSFSITSGSGIPTLTGDVYISSSGSLSLGAGSGINIQGDLDNAGTVSLLSPSNNGASGSLITNGSITNTGTMTAQRWISEGDTAVAANDYTWHSLSIPIANSTAGTIFPMYWVLQYDEASNSWSNIEGNDDPVLRGTGYYVKTIDTPKTLSFSGVFNTGTYPFTINNTGADAGHGYNLIGNPYPSSIDLEVLSLTNIGSTVWVWDPSTENYITHQIGGGASTLGQYIQPFQAFFVKVNAGSATGNVTFENNDRVHYSSGTFFKKSTSEIEDLAIKVSGNEKYDVLFIKNRDAVNDGYKFYSMNSDVPMIYTKDADTNYAIYNISGDFNEKRIQLGFWAGKSGNYTIEILDEGFDGYDLYLYDKLTQNSTKLSQGVTYPFSYDYNLNEDRFEIVFATEGLDIEPENQELTNIFSAGKYINIWNSTSESVFIEVFDITGKLVTQKNSFTDKEQIYIEKGGIYLVRVSDEDGKTQIAKVGIY